MADIVISCKDNQVVPEPVDGVYVRVFNEAGDTLITAGTTGSLVPGSGEVELVVPAGTYRVKLSMSISGWEVVGGSVQFIDVPDENPYAFDFVVELFQYPAATDPDLCRLSGFIVKGNKRPAPNVTIEFTPIGSPILVGADSVNPRPITVITDDDGYAVVDLIRDGLYSVLVSGLTDSQVDVRIPDRSWAGISDVLFPIVASVTFDPVSVILSVGEQVEVDVEVTMRSGLVLTLEEASSLVEFVSDPEGVVGILSWSSKLVLRGLAGGTTSVEALPVTTLVVRPDPVVTGALAVNVT